MGRLLMPRLPIRLISTGTRRWVIAMLAMTLTGCATERCRNEITRRAASPDRAHEAVFYHRDCGQGPTSEVAIIPYGADLPDVPTAVLTISQPLDVAMTWASPGRVVLAFAASAHVVARQDRSFDGVEVGFEQR